MFHTMADNYIEKRMAEIASGQSRGSVSFKGIDSLVRKSAAPAVRDEEYCVHPLQLAAIINLLDKAGIEGIQARAIPPSRLGFTCSGHEINPFLLGRAFQTVLLKAIDMGLNARCVDVSEPSFAAEVEIFRSK